MIYGFLPSATKRRYGVHLLGHTKAVVLSGTPMTFHSLVCEFYIVKTRLGRRVDENGGWWSGSSHNVVDSTCSRPPQHQAPFRPQVSHQASSLLLVLIRYFKLSDQPSPSNDISMQPQIHQDLMENRRNMPLRYIKWLIKHWIENSLDGMEYHLLVMSASRSVLVSLSHYGRRN
jgi:hypothetical protein